VKCRGLCGLLGRFLFSVWSGLSFGSKKKEGVLWFVCIVGVKKPMVIKRNI